MMFHLLDICFKNVIQTMFALIQKRYDGQDGIADRVSQLLLRDDAYYHYVLPVLLVPTF